MFSMGSTHSSCWRLCLCAVLQISACRTNSGRLESKEAAQQQRGREAERGLAANASI